MGGRDGRSRGNRSVYLAVLYRFSGFHCACRRPVALLCVLLGALLFSSAPALAARGHVFSKAFGGPCTGPGGTCEPGQFKEPLKEPSGVAVNEATGNVYVVDKGNNRVEYFNSTGTQLEGAFNGSGLLPGEGSGSPLGVFPGQFSEPEGIAIDNSCQLHKPALTETTTPLTCKAFDPSNGDVYVVDGGHDVIDKFSASGEYIGQLTGTSEGSFRALNGYGQFPIEVAVDTSGAVWVHQQEQGFHTGEMDKFTNEVANKFSPPAISLFCNIACAVSIYFPAPGFAVDAEDNFYIAAVLEPPSFVLKLNSAGLVLNEEVDREASTAVAVELSSNDVYVDNLTSVGRFSPSGVLLERLGSEDLTGGSGIGVSSTAEEVYVADSTADKVDVFTPEPPGPPTVEGESVSEVSSGSATFSAQINPRGAGTKYHFEYDTSEYTPNGPSHGISVPIPDASIGSGFNIQEVSSAQQDLSPGTEYHFRVVAQNNLGPAVDGPDQTFITQTGGGELVLPDGREWEMVSPPNKDGAAIDPILFGALQASEGGTAISYLAESPIEAEPKGNAERTQVFSRRGPGGWSSQDISTPYDAPVGLNLNRTEYQLFSSNLSLGLVEPLSPEASTPLSPETSEKTIYLRDDASGTYIPLVTAANVPPGTKFGGHLQFEGATPDLSHVVLYSSVALLASLPVEKGLYEWVAGQLQLVSVLPTGEPDQPASGELQLDAISNDGSRIVWSESTGGHDIFTSDMTTHTTTTVLVGEGSVGAVSPDGSKIYYSGGEYDAATGQTLALSGVPNGAGSYIASIPGGVSVLHFSASEAPGEAQILGAPEPSRISPNGRYVAFMSSSSLTGYNNLDVNSGKPDTEVFLYDASSNRLVCASCNPTGARPVGMLDSKADNEGTGPLIDRQSLLFEDQWLAGSIPGGTPVSISFTFYESRVLSDSGRLFFDSTDGLVPQDVNGVENVYEYEPEGIGSCKGSSVTFSTKSGGCVGLISSGTSSEESAFLDASASGNDVFFLTASRLVPQDVETSLAVYDAHVCSEAAPCFVPPPVVPPPCSTGDSCKPAPSPQPAIFGAPPSATFSGAGNLTSPAASKPAVKSKSLTRAQKLAKALEACAKKSKRKRAVCKAQARKRYGAKVKADGKKSERRGK